MSEDCHESGACSGHAAQMLRDMYEYGRMLDNKEIPMSERMYVDENGNVNTITIKDVEYYPTRYLGGSEPEHRYEGCFYPPVEPVWSVLQGSRRPTVGDLLAWVKTTR